MARRKAYTREQIIQRDKEKCWICGILIDLELKFPDPRCLTIDHIVPVSKGGTDTLKNVAIAHKLCNESKKDTLPCEWFENIEGIMFRSEGKTGLFLIVDDAELAHILDKLSRTRNKSLKKKIQNIIENIG